MRLLALLWMSQLVWAAPPKLRLPATARPTRYALELVIDPAKEKFSGLVTIDVELSAETPIVWLNATDLDLDEVRVVRGDHSLPARVERGDEDFVGIRPVSPLPPGPARLVIRYRGGIDAVRSRAIYRVDEGGVPYVYTMFEPIDARRAFPCFDEPSFKVPWQLTFHVPKGMRALGNAPVVRESPERDGLRVELAPSKPLPSYLVAFVVGPFELVDGGQAGRNHTAIRFVVPRGRAAETRWAREVTPRIVGELERWFDIPYPYEKLDVAVVPRYWGTMEHPGLVALGQPLTLIRPEEESLQRKQAYANIAAHELGHYWFGDYVTCAFWDDTWLNESFGSFIDGIVTDRVEPAWKWQPRHNVQHLEQALEADALPTAQSLKVPITSKDEIASSFDGGITYDKGSSLARMFAHFIGEERFRRMIGKYLSAHAFANASEADFLAALRAEDAGAAESFRSFAEQPGVPLISVEKRCDKTPHLEISQRRFFADGERRSDSRWTVPVCLAWDGGEKCLLLKEATAELPLDHCPSWVMPNLGAFGYYRSLWSGAQLQAIARELPKRPLAERRLLADDVQALADSGRLPLADAFTLLPALLADSELAVYRRGVGLFQLLHRAELDDKDRAAFDRALLSRVGPRARTLTFVTRDGEDPELPSTRQMVLDLLGREAADPRIRREARAAVEGWLADRKSLSQDLLQTALHVATADGDAALFDRLLAEAGRARDRQERKQLLSSLGGFRAPRLAERAFGLLLQKDLDLRDTSGILWLQLWDRENREGAWQRLRANWDAILGRMRDDEASWLVEAAASSFCDPAHRLEVATFLGAHTAGHAGAPHAMKKGLDLADQCIAAVERNRPAVREILRKF